MFSIARDVVPGDSLLRTHRGTVHPERWGNYGDCFSVDVDRTVTLSDFVFAFYTSPLFRIERLILRVLVGAPANDGGARALAQGSAKTFSIWYVGERSETQLLMCDRFERTRSWFRVAPLAGGKTLLQFGSAVAAARDRAVPESTAPERAQPPQEANILAHNSAVFRLLLRFHLLDSQRPLSAAKSGIVKNSPAV